MGCNNARNSWDHIKRGRKYQIQFHADGFLLLFFLPTYLNAAIKLNWTTWGLLRLKHMGSSWQVAQILRESSPELTLHLTETLSYTLLLNPVLLPVRKHYHSLSSCFWVSTLLCLKDMGRAKRDFMYCTEVTVGLAMHKTLPKVRNSAGS